MRKVTKLVKKGKLSTLVRTIPDWAIGHEDINNQTVVKMTSGKFGVLDWALQTIVAEAWTREECSYYIRGY